jgi:hypothetical protein
MNCIAIGDSLKAHLGFFTFCNTQNVDEPKYTIAFEEQIPGKRFVESRTLEALLYEASFPELELSFGA